MDERLRQKKERLRKLKEKQAELHHEANKQPSAFDLLSTVLNVKDTPKPTVSLHTSAIERKATLTTSTDTVPRSESNVARIIATDGEKSKNPNTSGAPLNDWDTAIANLASKNTDETQAPSLHTDTAHTDGHDRVQPFSSSMFAPSPLNDSTSMLPVHPSKITSPTLAVDKMDLDEKQKDRIMPMIATTSREQDQQRSLPQSMNQGYSNFRLTSTSAHETDNHLLRPLNDLRRNKDAIDEDDDDDSVSSYSSSSSLSSWNSEDERLGNRRGRYHKYLGNRNVDDNRAHQMAALKNNNKRRWPSIIERSSRSRSRSRNRSPTRSSTRSPSPPSDEVDEFGRVKRRRGKFYTERSDRTSRISDESKDGNMSEHKSASTRGYCKRSDIVPRERVRRDTGRRSRDREEGRKRSANRWRQMDDPYVAAASYIDTEFFATKIYVGELQNVTEKALRLAFERFGEIKHVKMVEGKEFAFITFDRKDQALKAIQHMNGSVLGRRSIKVNRAKIPERNRVGFGNVPWQDDDGMLAKQGEATDYLSSLAPQEKSISLQDRVATMHQLAAPLDAPSSESGYMLDPRAQLPMDPRAARAERQVLSYDDL